MGKVWPLLHAREKRGPVAEDFKSLVGNNGSAHAYRYKKVRAKKDFFYAN